MKFKEVLKTAGVDSKLRIVFKADVGGDNLYTQLGSLCHKLNFNFEWLVLVRECVGKKGTWEGVPRTQDFTITRMSGADRDMFAHIFGEIAESIEVL